MRELFGIIARGVASTLGSATAFVAATLLVLAWVALGPAFQWSSQWQLLVNTATTIVTFLMVFLIQNAENRDTTAIQIKLDELLRAIHDARNEFVDIEALSDAELDRLQHRFAVLREQYASTGTGSTSHQSEPATSGGGEGDSGDNPTGQ